MKSIDWNNQNNALIVRNITKEEVTDKASIIEDLLKTLRKVLFKTDRPLRKVHVSVGTEPNKNGYWVIDAYVLPGALHDMLDYSRKEITL